MRKLRCMDLHESEHQKYATTWEDPWYRQNSPAQRSTTNIIGWLERHAIKNVVDLGCGCGRLDLELMEKGYSVRMIDIADNCLDEKVRRRLCADLTFETGCIWSDDVADVRADGVICIDVLEHLPPETVPAACASIRAMAPHGFVNAALFPHVHRGQTLHLTVKDAHFWFKLFPEANHKVSPDGRHAWMIW